MKRIGVIMGSDSDFDGLKPAFTFLNSMGVHYEAHVCSAHRTPDAAADFAKNAAARGFGVIIAAAGKAAHLAGAIAAHTILPVIGIPMKSSELDGMDALLSTVQMPPGVPVATVAVNGSLNAAILACQILAVNEAGLAERLAVYKENMRQSALNRDKLIQEKLGQL
ncbi:MAG: 5-(carboxyamino)imidazole ribonucleotide mutase [Oscillospiraceae bacterium]|jgi:5-(carboxyamino)imidazole ribonucleotide mutase|nr:5-(carboxyamino)imidazole ribonucleotide mutase [Oscillospiraceae bacterium]